MTTSTFSAGIHLVDFEFYPAHRHEGNAPVPVCLVMREWPSGLTHRYWQDELATMTAAPFPTGSDALCVAYYASAEMDCFAALGWPAPVNLLDLFAEFRCLTNYAKPYKGRKGVKPTVKTDPGVPAHGNGLLGALLHYGLASINAEEKTAMRDLILTGGPWDDGQRVECHPELTP